MAKRKNKARQSRGRNKQILVSSYTANIVSAPQVFTAQTVGIINNRPCVVRAVSVTYSRAAVTAPTAAIGFSMTLHSATGEEIRTSPPLLPANATKTFVLRAPRSTDYGTFPSNGPVFTINNGSGLSIVFTASVQYQMQPLNVLTKAQQDGEHTHDTHQSLPLPNSQRIYPYVCDDCTRACDLVAG